MIAGKGMRFGNEQTFDRVGVARGTSQADYAPDVAKGRLAGREQHGPAERLAVRSMTLGVVGVEQMAMPAKPACVVAAACERPLAAYAIAASYGQRAAAEPRTPGKDCAGGRAEYRGSGVRLQKSGARIADIVLTEAPSGARIDRGDRFDDRYEGWGASSFPPNACGTRRWKKPAAVRARTRCGGSRRSPSFSGPAAAIAGVSARTLSSQEASSAGALRGSADAPRSGFEQCI